MWLKHKQMCGCEICIIIIQIQESLNSFLSKLLRKLDNTAKTIPYTNDKAKRSATEIALKHEYVAFPFSHPIQPKPKYTLKEVMCQPVERFELSQMDFVLRCCCNCLKFS